MVDAISSLVLIGAMFHIERHMQCYCAPFRYKRSDVLLVSPAVGWNAFWRCLEFHCNVREMLHIQSSLFCPDGMTLANGYLDAEIVR